MPTTPGTEDLLARLAGLSDPTDLPTDTHELLATLGGVRGRLDAAARLMDQGRTVPSESRLRGLKQTMATGLRPITGPQAAYNASMTDAVLTLTEVLDGLLRQRDHVDALADAVGALNETVARFGALAEQADRTAVSQVSVADPDSQPTLEYLIERIHQLRGQLDKLMGTSTGPAPTDAIGDLQARMAVLQARQNLLARAYPTSDQVTAQTDHASDTAPLSTFDRLYEDFEDRFRGSRSFVKEMLGPYVDDVAGVHHDGPVIDIGSGRGEWLELLADADIPAYGLDHNQVAVARCRERGLDARDDDVIEHLRSLEEGSVRAVTAFHVVEHLPFDDTVALLDAALVALAPGGLLILETPNATNLTVGGSFFWIDPTHIRPMHPELLEFVVTERGFTDTQVHFVHPRDELRLDPAHLVAPATDPVAPEEAADETGPDVERTVAAVEQLNRWIFGHLDYAILARRPGRPTDREVR